VGRSLHEFPFITPPHKIKLESQGLCHSATQTPQYIGASCHPPLLAGVQIKSLSCSTIISNLPSWDVSHRRLHHTWQHSPQVPRVPVLHEERKPRPILARSPYPGLHSSRKLLPSTNAEAENSTFMWKHDSSVVTIQLASRIKLVRSPPGLPHTSPPFVIIALPGI
jgi:hypothetical protein